MEKIKSLWNSFVASFKENKAFRIKTIIIAAVAVVVVAGVIIACVCLGGNEEPPVVTDPSTQTTQPSGTDAPNGMLDYSVTVTDAKGNPMAGVIINFLQNGTTCAMQQTNEQGVAVKNLTAGEYTIELAFTDADASYAYNTDIAVVTPDAAQITIVLYNGLGDEVKNLSAYSAVEGAHMDYTAYYVTVGSTQVTLDPEERNYFIFVPTVDGIYEFSTDNESVVVGYYGSTYFVQENNLADVTENGSITTDIAPSMINLEGVGTSALVIGLDGNGENKCVLTIERIGDHVTTMEEYPWDIYKTTAELNNYTLPANINLVDFDVTAASDTYKLVFNEDDGFYHMNSANGPLVYVKLGVDSQYLDSLQKVVDNSDVNRYFFDENDEFVKKENYTECLVEYIGYMDEDAGVYPLTEDLKYIIQQRGEYVGWWDTDSPSFIFNDSNGNPIIGLNTDIAWLFVCCYGEEIPEETEPTEPQPTEPEETEPEETKPTEPEETEPEETKPTEPEVTEPEETEPEETEPAVSYTTYSGAVAYSNKKVNVSGTCINSDTPIELGGELALSFEVEAGAGECVYYNLYKIAGTILNIKSDNVYVIYDGTTYGPKNGVLTLPMYSSGPSVPVQLYIGNSGDQAETFEVSLTYPKGSYSNPVNLVLGGMETYTEAGDEDGFYFTYTAASSGTLTISFESINIDKDCMITVYNLTTYEYNSNSNKDASVKVNKGDLILITVGVSDDKYEYPAACIKTIATLD